MRDFPFFTTEYGVSSLILREIPYKKEAYIRILDIQEGMLEEHMGECISFCRMAGADRVYAAGEGLQQYPEGAAVFEMRGQVSADPGKTACLFPVTRETVARWRQLHNEAMANVDNAGTLTSRDEQKILEKGGAYFVHESGELLGIGWIEEGRILAVAAMRRGAGERVMHTLLSLMQQDMAVLEVASTNRRAIALYEKLGFVKTALLTQWHRVYAAGELTEV